VNVNTHVSLLLNIGAGALRATLDYGAPGEFVGTCGFGHAVSMADLNGDRRLDLAVAGSFLCVLINKPGLCDVQELRGMTIVGATRLLARGHCRGGTVLRAYAARVRRGRVISQKPGFGVVLPGGGKVSLVVSRGRKR
jgi:hypothetical protein